MLGLRSDPLVGSYVRDGPRRRAMDLPTGRKQGCPLGAVERLVELEPLGGVRG